MASPRPDKPRACLVPNYYEGYLEKMENKSQKYKRYWAVLRGNELFFQVTSRDPMYIEKINLEDFMSVEDDKIYNNNRQHVMILKMKSGDIKLKADTLEALDQWRSFIHTVTKLEIPNQVLLPGQIRRLQEVLEQETKQRRMLWSSPPPLPPPRSTTPELDQNNYDDVENDRLSCFYKVSRMEAENLLAKNKEFGNLLMRPSHGDQNLAITTRQVINNMAIVNHYRINCLDSGYIIYIGNGILCNSRQEIIDYFIQQTKGILKPLEIPEDYEINLSIVVEDAESGELIHQKLPTSPTLEIKTLRQLVKRKLNPKKPAIIEPKTCSLDNNGMAKEKPRTCLKTEPQAKPSQPINRHGLMQDVNEELSKMFEQKRAANSD
ncbi:signal-transducing adaptor protein 1-like isoform X1 [Amblyraja radiata]|uniref:signal-transducing adaptor protein 1-like isoform X1 n=1 Tax=Amblyraja radiata TaxID=386614 RepID=UPI0014022669|nr:signal-transducing adaptor protein 1-like isoform X1 [Amblyraja radiata]